MNLTRFFWRRKIFQEFLQGPEKKRYIILSLLLLVFLMFIIMVIYFYYIFLNFSPRLMIPLTQSLIMSINIFICDVFFLKQTTNYKYNYLHANF